MLLKLSQVDFVDISSGVGVPELFIDGQDGLSFEASNTTSLTMF